MTERINAFEYLFKFSHQLIQSQYINFIVVSLLITAVNLRILILILYLINLF